MCSKAVVSCIASLFSPELQYRCMHGCPPPPPAFGIPFRPGRGKPTGRTLGEEGSALLKVQGEEKPAPSARGRGPGNAERIQRWPLRAPRHPRCPARARRGSPGSVAHRGRPPANKGQRRAPRRGWTGGSAARPERNAPGRKPGRGWGVGRGEDRLGPAEKLERLSPPSPRSCPAGVPHHGSVLQELAGQ